MVRKLFTSHSGTQGEGTGNKVSDITLKPEGYTRAVAGMRGLKTQ